MLLSLYRSWIFSLFVVLFGVTASLVLFYAFGYRYSFERGIFIFSGSVTVKTIPETVNIEIDGEAIPRQRLGLLNNSVHIAGLMPGEHRLRLTAPDHHPWEKRLVVESGISREFWNIILPRFDYPITPLPATEDTLRVFPHPTNDDNFILVKERAGETSLVVFDYPTGLSRQVFALPETSLDRERGDHLEWSWFDDGRYIILPVKRAGVFEHLIIDTLDGSFFSLEARFALSDVRLARWNTGEPNELLFLADKTLYRLSLAPESFPLSVSESVVTYSLSDDTLYLVGQEGQVWEVDGSRLVTVSPPIPFAPDTRASLTVYERDRLAFLEEGGEERLFLVYPDPADQRAEVKLAASGVKTVQFSNDGKKLLFATNHEIGIIFANDWEVQPRREAGEIVQVARFSDRIAHIQWAENYEHVIFSRGPVVKFIELDGRDFRVLADITTLPTEPVQVLPHFSTNEFLMVVPGHGVQALVFPEPQSLFGQ